MSILITKQVENNQIILHHLQIKGGSGWCSW